MRNNKLVLIPLLIIILLISSCSNDFTNNENTHEEIVDNDKLYENDIINSVKEIYITVLPIDNRQPEYAYTLSELNAITLASSDIDIKLRVIFQEGKDGGSQQGYFGYGLTSENGIMELRGQTSRNAKQKSYKIELTKGGGLWDSFEEINLNKHPYDSVLIRNKLSFDFIKLIPNLTSSRTQFVHLFIKDLSEGDFNREFSDYGLFTHIEDIDKDYLKNHNLDTKGWLYKAELFEFYRYEDIIRLKSDPDYNEKRFEDILPFKGNDNHEKLINMLNDVNNRFIHINDVINKHFDRENYITWLALNILIDNRDTTSRNFYLYSANDSNKWYFIPWDYDGGWNNRSYDNTEVELWRSGITNYWGVVLHKRFFQNKDNIKELTEKIESLSRILNEETTQNFLDAYRPVVEYFLSREPDNLRINPEEFLLEYESLPSLIQESKARYYESLENPMSVFMGETQKIGHHYSFNWTESYDLQGDYIKYNLEISDSPTFETVVYSKENITETEHVVDGLQPGEYYWRLTIIDSQGNRQAPFDYYVDVNHDKYFGIKKIIIH